MTGDARRALTRLLNAFENHFDIARDGDEADDAALEAAELALRDAFFTYDDILFTQLGVGLPFDILDENHTVRPLVRICKLLAATGRPRRAPRESGRAAAPCTPGGYRAVESFAVQ